MIKIRIYLLYKITLILHNKSIQILKLKFKINCNFMQIFMKYSMGLKKCYKVKNLTCS